MKLRTLPPATLLKGKRVLLRLDWNIPLGGHVDPSESLKIERSLQTLKWLTGKGAIVIVLTHLGRPKHRDAEHSTHRLVGLLQRRYRLKVAFHPESVMRPAEHERLMRLLSTATSGSIHLLENVRFEFGEEENDPDLAAAYASLGDLFINDAFASCHRAHASVVGIVKRLPSYAGPELVAEVAALERLLVHPRKPFIAIVGGLKISSKIGVLRSLFSKCQSVFLGGAMATTVWAAMHKPTGSSFVEKDALLEARALAQNKKIVLPIDVGVTRVQDKELVEYRPVDDVQSGEMIVDVGPKTLEDWAKRLKKAKTILWNGPVGVAEEKASAAGSRRLAQIIGGCPQAFTVVGGGDTLPLIVATRMEKHIRHVSTGGGALLEFIAKKGKLPGIISLRSSRGVQ